MSWIESEDPTPRFKYGPLANRAEFFYEHVPVCQSDPHCGRNLCGFSHPARESRKVNWTHVYPLRTFQPASSEPQPPQQQQQTVSQSQQPRAQLPPTHSSSSGSSSSSSARSPYTYALPREPPRLGSSSSSQQVSQQALQDGRRHPRSHSDGPEDGDWRGSPSDPYSMETWQPLASAEVHRQTDTNRVPKRGSAPDLTSLARSSNNSRMRRPRSPQAAAVGRRVSFSDKHSANRNNNSHSPGSHSPLSPNSQRSPWGSNNQLDRLEYEDEVDRRKHKAVGEEISMKKSSSSGSLFSLPSPWDPPTVPRSPPNPNSRDPPTVPRSPPKPNSGSPSYPTRHSTPLHKRSRSSPGSSSAVSSPSPSRHAKESTQSSPASADRNHRFDSSAAPFYPGDNTGGGGGGFDARPIPRQNSAPASSASVDSDQGFKFHRRGAAGGPAELEGKGLGEDSLDTLQLLKSRAMQQHNAAAVVAAVAAASGQARRPDYLSDYVDTMDQLDNEEKTEAEIDAETFGLPAPTGPDQAQDEGPELAGGSADEVEVVQRGGDTLVASVPASRESSAGSKSPKPEQPASRTVRKSGTKPPAHNSPAQHNVQQPAAHEPAVAQQQAKDGSATTHQNASEQVASEASTAAVEVSAAAAVSEPDDMSRSRASGSTPVLQPALKTQPDPAPLVLAASAAARTLATANSAASETVGKAIPSSSKPRVSFHDPVAENADLAAIHHPLHSPPPHSALKTEGGSASRRKTENARRLDDDDSSLNHKDISRAPKPIPPPIIKNHNSSVRRRHPLSSQDDEGDPPAPKAETSQNGSSSHAKAAPAAPELEPEHDVEDDVANSASELWTNFVAFCVSLWSLLVFVVLWLKKSIVNCFSSTDNSRPRVKSVRRTPIQRPPKADPPPDALDG